MSLRTRVFLLTIAVTGSIVGLLFAVQLITLVDSWLRGSEEIAKIAGQQIKHLIIARVQQAPSNDWAGMLEDDPGLRSLLESTMAETRSILEISVADANGSIIASSNPDRVGSMLLNLPHLETLRASGAFARLSAAVTRSRDYQLAIPLGVLGESRPVFTIQVVVSSVLLREELVPETKRMFAWGLAALIASVALAWLSSRLAIGDLERVSVVIDRLSAGTEPPPVTPADRPSPELANIQSKLDILGHRFRSAAELRDNVNVLLEGLEEAILLCDAGGRILLCGGPVGRVLGVEPHSLIGKHIAAAFSTDRGLAAVASNAFARQIAVKQNVNGRLLSVEFTADHADLNRLTGMVRVRDAAADRELESHLDVSARLDAINRITSSVAHEIKNPLNAIAVRIDNLQAMDPGDPDAGGELDCIAQEVNRLDRVVRTFLDFTRPVELAQVPIDITALVKDVAQLLTPDARRFGVDVEYPADTQALWVRGDEDLLKDAVINIAANGIEAMSDGGTLRLSVSRQGDQCLVTIADTGPGIPPEQRDRIFDLYFTTKKNGSGLGLAMAYRAAQLHRGEIRLDDSSPGASFRLLLPIMNISGPVRS